MAQPLPPRDDDTVEAPSPPISSVTPRTKQRTKAVKRVLESPGERGCAAAVEAVATLPVVTAAMPPAPSDYLHGNELDAVARQYLFA